MASSCILYHCPLLSSNYCDVQSFRDSERLAWAGVEHGESLFHPGVFAFGEDVGTLIHSSIKLCFWIKTKQCWNQIIFLMASFCHSSQMAVCLVASSLWSEQESGKGWEFSYIQLLSSHWWGCTLALSAVYHLNLDVMESQMAKELCKYLLAFKSLGFEWVVYVKTVPTDWLLS